MSKIHLIGGKGYVGALLHNYLKAARHEVELASYRLPDIWDMFSDHISF